MASSVAYNRVSSSTWLLHGMLAGLCMAFSIQVAQYLGADRQQDARGVLRQSMLFNLAVEYSITNHLLAEDADMDAEMYRKYRGYSVREVTDTQGAFSFRDALRLHRRQ